MADIIKLQSVHHYVQKHVHFIYFCSALADMIEANPLN
nr:MAG TPA: hypothetical protein [Caudoviricetes sp.]